MMGSGAGSTGDRVRRPGAFRCTADFLSPIAPGIKRGVWSLHSLIRPRTTPTSAPPSGAPGALPPLRARARAGHARRLSAGGVRGRGSGPAHGPRGDVPRRTEGRRGAHALHAAGHDHLRDGRPLPPRAPTRRRDQYRARLTAGRPNTVTLGTPCSAVGVVLVATSSSRADTTARHLRVS